MLLPSETSLTTSNLDGLVGPFEVANKSNRQKDRTPDQPPSTLVDLAFHHHHQPPSLSPGPFRPSTPQEYVWYSTARTTSCRASRAPPHDSGRNIAIPRIPAGIGMAEGPAKRDNSVGYIPAEYSAERPEWGIRWDSAAEYEVTSYDYVMFTPAVASPSAATFRHHVDPRAHDSLAPRRPRHIALPATSNVADPATTTLDPSLPGRDCHITGLRGRIARWPHRSALRSGGGGPEAPVSTPNPIHTSSTPVNAPASTSDPSAAVSNQPQPRELPRRPQLDPPRRHFKSTAATSTPSTAGSTSHRPPDPFQAHRRLVDPPPPLTMRTAHVLGLPWRRPGARPRRRFYKRNPTISTPRRHLPPPRLCPPPLRRPRHVEQTPAPPPRQLADVARMPRHGARETAAAFSCRPTCRRFGPSVVVAAPLPQPLLPPRSPRHVERTTTATPQVNKPRDLGRGDRPTGAQLVRSPAPLPMAMPTPPPNTASAFLPHQAPATSRNSSSMTAAAFQIEFFRWRKEQEQQHHAAALLG
ncbi:hypothetical protein GALMADRAFT_148240 [Galerina marginata CBS 339.88]|uniref:Uncharacterized protein n=1 Tax=Galerina marginata (strain CBS 339.88) TaxID=685588 RepID=A0A067S7S7_GALM3|nr:hypothetical protein GALMADRAFT_148240 [Galerina marginata CBS 339.88]